MASLRKLSARKFLFKVRAKNTDRQICMLDFYKYRPKNIKMSVNQTDIQQTT